MGLCWQMPKFIVWSIYFDHHLPLKPSIGKRRKQSCTPNTYIVYVLLLIFAIIVILNLLPAIWILTLSSTTEIFEKQSKFFIVPHYIKIWKNSDIPICQSLNNDLHYHRDRIVFYLFSADLNLSTIIHN